MSENAKDVERTGFFRRRESLRPQSFGYLVGIFATKCAIATIIFVPAGTYVGKKVIEHGSQHVAEDLKPTIDDNGSSLRLQITEEIDPTKKDLQTFTEKGDKFFSDYEEFKVAVCREGIIKLQSCPEILTEADKNNPESQQAAGAATTTQLPQTTIPVTTTP